MNHPIPMEKKPGKRFQGRLARTMLLFLLPLALLPVLLMGGTVYFLSYNYLKGQTTGQLDSLVDSTSTQISSLIEKKQQFLSDLLTKPNFRLPLGMLISQGRDLPIFPEVHSQLLAEYTDSRNIETEPSFDNIFVVTSEKVILLSSNPAWEGLRINGGPLESLLGQTGSIATYKGSPISGNRFTVFTALPIQSDDGAIEGTLFGVSNPSILRSDLDLGAVIHPDTRAYYLSKDGLFIGVQAGKQELTALRPSLDQQTRLVPMAKEQATGNLQNLHSFDNRPVIAYTKWIPQIQNQLIIEVPVDVINNPLRTLSGFSIPLILGALLLSGILVWQGANRLAAPLVSLTQTTDRFAEGDWQQRATVDRNDEIGRLADSFNQMADQLSGYYSTLEEKVEARTIQVRTASELAQMATSITDVRDLLRRTVTLIVERFEYYDASVFLVDETGTSVLLAESWESARGQKPLREFQLPVGSVSMIGWVTKNNMLHVANNIHNDDFYLPDEQRPETQSEAVLPISVGDQVLGALDVQSNRPNAFQAEDIASLKTLANQVAASLQNIRLLEAAKINLEETSLLYQASRKISQSETIADIYTAIAKALEGTKFFSLFLINEEEHAKVVSLSTPISPGQIQKPAWLPFSLLELDPLIPQGKSAMIIDVNPDVQLPESLRELLGGWNCDQAVLIPIYQEENLSGLMVLSDPEKGSLTRTEIQPFTNLAEMASTALAKVLAQSSMEARLNELETLNQVSQAIAAQANLEQLYQTIHHAINQALGVVNFLIALYDPEKDQIQIPYMFEDDRVLSVDPFPLGEGLTSIVIRNKQPLLLANLDEEKLAELGAKIIGAPAKSWLGTPMIVAGEVIGALVIQDLEQENRFSQDDLRLFSTLSAQVAGSIRNAYLLEKSQTQAARERFLHEATSRIRNSINREAILEATAEELSRVLKAHRARIEIGLDGQEHANPVKEKEAEG